MTVINLKVLISHEKVCLMCVNCSTEERVAVDQAVILNILMTTQRTSL